ALRLVPSTPAGEPMPLRQTSGETFAVQPHIADDHDVDRLIVAGNVYFDLTRHPSTYSTPRRNLTLLPSLRRGHHHNTAEHRQLASAIPQPFRDRSVVRHVTSSLN